MRDPARPIPSPRARNGAAFWRHSAPPPPGRSGLGYDPTRLLAERADYLGIDRRAQPRAMASTRTRGRQPVSAGGHLRLPGILGLRTRHGWALVRGLTLAPHGALVQLLDLLDPDLDPHERRKGRAAFARLVSQLGASSSPLCAVGGCLLASRVVADLSAWINAGAGGRATSRARAPIPVTLVVPPTGRAGVATIVSGELTPLNDPCADVLAVALSAAARGQLGLAVRAATPPTGTTRPKRP